MGTCMTSAKGLKIGCCGFPSSLARYAEAFAVVEVQQTFYQPPLSRTLARWRSQVPAEFEFTLKAWQVITHEASSPTYRRLRERLNEKQKREVGGFRPSDIVMSAWERTLDCARILRSHAILFQCPARFVPTREHKDNLRTFFRHIRQEAKAPSADERMTFVWEPRGEWKREEVRDLCEELDLIHAVDPFQQQPVTPGMGYLRLHGRTGYRYRYSDEDMESLSEMARGYLPCYVLFNNISMLEDARRFLKLVSQP